MGRKRKADAIDSTNESNKESEITNGTSVTNNDNLLSSMQTAAAGQQPVTAAKTSAAIVVATPGSNLSTDQKSKVSKPNPAKKKTKKELKAAKKAAKGEESDDDGPKEDDEDIEMPADNILYKLVDRLEAQLPRDDHVKYDSREKKIDWKKVSWEGGLNPAECKRYWNYIQDRIRRFRIMAELVPDARHWIAHPWTNFYKSKDYNRHPDMPKKPLSMYMLYYSEKREEILAEQPKLSMPEVAKICSEQYQKLSDKKKARYKQRCDEMRRQYEQRLANFYEEHPTLRPVKPEKAKKALAAKQLKQKAAEALQEQQAAQQQAAQQAAQQQAAQQQAAQQQAAQQQAQQQQLQQQQLQQQQQQQQLQQQIQIQQPQFSIQNGPPPPGTVQVVQNGQPMMVQNIVQTTNAAGEPIYMVQQAPMQPQPQPQSNQPRPMTALPPPSVLAQAGMPIQAQSPLPLQTPLPPHALQQQTTSTPTPPPLPQAPQAIPVTLPLNLPQQPQPQQQVNNQFQVASASSPATVTPSTTSTTAGASSNVFSSAPERPAKPFDLYFKAQMDAHAGDTNFDRQSCAEKYRAEWKTMKLKKKAKWIKKAAENYREYDENITAFIAKNPGYVPPQHKSFLTQEDQKILDKFMGRPEKPPSSAYSLFSKEMLNNVEIKKFPSKERMAQISEKWKILPQEQKDMYQAEVNRSMGVYRQKYEDWFNGLSEAERKAETSRMNSGKSTRARNNAAAAAAAAQGLPVPAKASPAKLRQQQQQQQQQIQQEQQMQQDQQHQLQQNQFVAQVAAAAPTVVEPKIVSVPAHGVTPVGPPMNLTPTLMVPTGHPMHVPPGSAAPGSMVAVSTAQPIPISIPTQPVQMQAATNVMQPQQQAQPQTVTLHHGGIIGPYKDHTALRAEILKREPVEPARSPKQLFITDWLAKHKKKKVADAKEAWKNIGKQEKKKWLEKLEPQRQKYIEDYTVFVRGLDKEELEMYTELKQKRDEEEEQRRQNESSDSDSDDSDESDDDSDSDSDSDSDM